MNQLGVCSGLLAILAMLALVAVGSADTEWGNRWKVTNGVQENKYLGLVRPSSIDGKETCELCRKEYPTTQFFEIELEEQFNSWPPPGRKYHLGSCFEAYPGTQPQTYYQDYFTQYCGSNSSFEAGVEGGLGDGKEFSSGLRRFNNAGDDVYDKSQCCQRCNQKEGCDMILYKKSASWECCWYYGVIPGRKVVTNVPLNDFVFSGVCDATSE